jgi:hypothetical protein
MGAVSVSIFLSQTQILPSAIFCITDEIPLSISPLLTVNTSNFLWWVCWRDNASGRGLPVSDYTIGQQCGCGNIWWFSDSATNPDPLVTWKPWAGFEYLPMAFWTQTVLSKTPVCSGVLLPLHTACSFPTSLESCSMTADQLWKMNKPFCYPVATIPAWENGVSLYVCGSLGMLPRVPYWVILYL